MVRLLVEREDKGRKRHTGGEFRTQGQRPFVANHAPHRLAILLVEEGAGSLGLKRQACRGRGLWQHRVALQLPLPQRIHAKGAERRRLALEPQRQKLRLIVRRGTGAQHRQRGTQYDD